MASKNSSSGSAGAGKSFWTPGRALLTFIVAGLLTTLGLSSCNSTEVTNKTNPPANKAPVNAPPKTAPPSNAIVTLPPDLRDKSLKTLDGEALKLSDYKDKVLIVNIWATWCGPCKLEMPDLVKISGEYKSRGVVVLGLATTYNEHDDPVHVKDYVRAQKVPYKIIWDDGTLAQPLVQLVAGRSVIPQSFVIARDGRIVKHFTGYSELSTPQLMRQAIEEALNDKGKA